MKFITTKLTYIILGILILLALGSMYLFDRNQEETIRIGWIGALTGTATQWGEPALKAANIRLEQINRNGGINGKKLEFIVEDSGSDAKQSVTAAQKLIEIDKVKIFFTHSSTESIAVAPMAESNKVLMFASASSAPDLTNAGDYIFRLTPVNREGEIIAKHLNANGAKNIAILYEDAKYPIPIKDAIKKTFKGEVVFEESFTPKTIDYRTVALKIKSKNPEVIIILPFGIDQGLNLIKEFTELQITSPVYGNAVFDTPTAFSKINPPRTMYFSTLFIDDQSEEVLEYKKQYSEKYGSEIPVLAHTLDAVAKIDLIAEGIEKCGNVDVRCLKEFLYSLKQKKTISGIVSIDQFGDADKQFVIKKLVDGKLQPE